VGDPVPDEGTAKTRLGGRLLVASPRLADPNFSRTVVLVIEHDEPGALGVVLNRPLQVEVGEILAAWKEHAEEAPPAVIFSGGPVSPDAVIALAPPGVTAPTGEWRPVVPGVGVIDLSVAPEDQPVALTGVRLFSGYAGWGPGQLEQELEDGGWLVVSAVAADAFASEPGDLWHDVLQRQGGSLAMLATYPPSPSVN
jgi:putative transcriptional regulator